MLSDNDLIINYLENGLSTGGTQLAIKNLVEKLKVKIHARNVQIADLKKRLSCFKKVAIYNCEGLLLRYEWQNINEN